MIWRALFSLVASANDIPDEMALDVLASLLAKPSADEPVYCLSIDRRDPSAQVLAMLRRQGYAIEPASECHYEKVAEHRSEARTIKNNPAAFFDLEDLTPKPAGVMSITYWHRAATWEGYGSTVDIHQQDGRWEIVEKSYYRTEE